MPNPFILFDDNRLGGGGRGLLFSRARRWVVAEHPDDVEKALDALRSAAAEGLWAAGYASYELGYCLEEKLLPLLPATRTVPLLCFGLFESPDNKTPAEIAAFLEQEGARNTTRMPEIRFAWDEEAYATRFACVRDYLAAGDTYQVNLTFPVETALGRDALSFYKRWRMRQRAFYGAFMNLPGLQVLSFSPELFFAVEKGLVKTQPMKGTAARGLTWAQDEVIIDTLKNDEKAQAENRMIVDLMRNDVGRIARMGSVRVKDMFSVITLPTVHQMTTTVEAELRDGLGPWDVFRALFPCGSVTGAPKIRAMEIIRELETAPRGLYCGAMGYVSPHGDAQFNVAIRTLGVGPFGMATGGVGGGLVTDSGCKNEYKECLLKAKFMQGKPADAAPFSLFETLRWSRKDGFQYLEDHLARLEESARYFGFTCDPDRARKRLQRIVDEAPADFMRVKLSLFEDGRMQVDALPFHPIANDVLWNVKLSNRRVESGSMLLYHKTSRRGLYETEFARAQQEGFDEVLFLNERGEVTEGSRTNIFWRTGENWFTPSLSAGLLPGILRGRMLQKGTQEKIVTPEILRAAAEIYVGNALRGLVRVKLAQVG